MSRTRREEGESRYSALSFTAALVSALIVELTLWAFQPYFLLMIYALPLLVVGVATGFVLERRHGRASEIGRGVLVGLLAAPVALLVFVPAFLAAQGLGLL